MKKRSTGSVGPKVTRLAAIGIAVFFVGAGTVLARSAVTTGWPASKAQIYQQQQQALAQARANPRPKLPSAGVANAPLPSPQRQAGIVSMHQGPFPPSTFVVRNFWQGPVGSEWVLAYAGATQESPDRPPQLGAVRLYSESASMQLSEIGVFPAAPGTAPLTITAANGDVLQLRSDSGATLSFNLQTHLYQ